MPPTTRSNGKPPPSRIYHTTPTLHQAQFPARRKIVKTYTKKKASASKDTSPQDADPSKPTPSASSRAKKSSDELDPRQKTLTQIDFVSSSFSGHSDIEFSDSDEEKENGNPEEQDDQDDEPVSSTKRKRGQKDGNKSKRRRTLGDQAENTKRRTQKGKSRRKTLGDAPTASAYHTQTLTQFVGRDTMMIRDSEDEDEDEGGFDDWLKEADSPTIRAKNHPIEQNPGPRHVPNEEDAGPSTPTRNKPEKSIWELPSSSQSATPLSDRMLARYGGPNSNKPTPTKATQQEIITEAKGKAPALVIEDSYGTASWESLSRITPSKKTPSKGTPLKDITEEVAGDNQETPSRRASQRVLRGSQRSTTRAKTGKENETPKKSASQGSQRGTPTPQKRKSPKKLAGGKFEIPDSDDDEDGFSYSEAGDAQGQIQDQENLVTVQQHPAAHVAAEQPVVLGDPSEVLGQETYVENADVMEAMRQQVQVGTQATQQSNGNDAVELGDEGTAEEVLEEHQSAARDEQEKPTLVDETQHCDSAGNDSELPESTAAPFTHLDKTPQGGQSVPDYGFQSLAPSSSKGDDQATHVDKTQQEESVKAMLPPSSALTTQHFTHIDKTPQVGGPIMDYGFNSSAPSPARGEEASYLDKTQQPESVRPMLPPSSAVTSEQLTHLDKTQQDNETLPSLGFGSSAPQSFLDKTQQLDSAKPMLPSSSAVTNVHFSHVDKTPQGDDVPVSYDFEAFPPTSTTSTQEDEPYTHIEKTPRAKAEVTPRAHVRFQSTPAIIPSPQQPMPTATQDEVLGTQDTEGSSGEIPFATAKEVAVETTELGPTKSLGTEKGVHRGDGAEEDNYTGAETQDVWKEIESSKEDPFHSTTSTHQRTAPDTPHTSPQLPTPKPAAKITNKKPLRKPLRNLPPSSQTQPLESQRIPLATIQAMGQSNGRTDIILPVPSSSLAPLVSGHTLHLSIPFKAPTQVVRFWLFENRKVIRYVATTEFEQETVGEKGQKMWRYFIPQVFELNNPHDEAELYQEGFIYKEVEKYTYLDPGPVAQLLSNLRQALFSPDGDEETQSLLTEIEKEPTQQDEPPAEHPRKDPGSSFSVSQAVEAQLLSEQATAADDILCPSTPLKERPSAPLPSTNPLEESIPQSPARPYVRPSQATTASQVSTPEKPSQYLPAGAPTTPRRTQHGTSEKEREMPTESSSMHLTFPDSESSPPFLIPLSQAGGLRSSQLLTKSQMLPDSLVRDDGGWDGSG